MTYSPKYLICAVGQRDWIAAEAEKRGWKKINWYDLDDNPHLAFYENGTFTDVRGNPFNLPAHDARTATMAQILEWITPQEEKKEWEFDIGWIKAKVGSVELFNNKITPGSLHHLQRALDVAKTPAPEKFNPTGWVDLGYGDYAKELESGDGLILHFADSPCIYCDQLRKLISSFPDLLGNDLREELKAIKSYIMVKRSDIDKLLEKK